MVSPVKNRTSTLSKTFISRVTAPFASKQRSPVELEIHLDEPFRQYFCGDTVKGAAVLSTTKASRITHLVIRLHGFVKVVNNARLPGETIPYDENLLTSMRRRKGIEYFGNGFARLFEDEHILCGDGRVSGVYQFRFELDLPSKGIPSSIDVSLNPFCWTWSMWLTRGIQFEHGTISYLITSTLTRPNTISPILTAHHKLNVTGTVNIAHLQPPKPHVVSLETISKKNKSRIHVKRKSLAMQNGKNSICPSLEGQSMNRTPLPSPQASDVPPQSPVPSTISSASTGESTSSAHNQLRTLTSGEVNGSVENSCLAQPLEKAITAKTELLQGGCLPGDTLQLRISIDHSKPIKSMQGIIITVFRQGRIDTHPALPLGPSERGGKSHYEDYYPKSRTGLGGLSLSSAGSSRVFRQDLAQTITPLIIDPQTLNANIKTSIQMPDHAFPTITCVPGEMISFRYFVEVVIDLRGKTIGQDRFLPHLSITNAPQHSYGDPKVSKVDGIDGVSYSATPGFNYLITDQIRRTKGVVFTTTEIIVGTKDTTRSRGKQRKRSDESDQIETAEHSQPDGDHQSLSAPNPVPPHQMPSLEDRPIMQEPSLSSRFNRSMPVFPPPVLDEPQDEKSQIRRAEERLLPSSPPQDGGPSAAVMAPIAPFAHNEEDFVQRYAFRAPAPSYGDTSVSDPRTEGYLSSQLQDPPAAVLPPQVLTTECQHDNQEPGSRRLQPQTNAPEQTGEGRDTPARPLTCSSQFLESNAPQHEDTRATAPLSSLPAQPGQEDKQELERRRLEAQVDSPDNVPDDENESSLSTSRRPQHPAPSAPRLDEVEVTHPYNDNDHEELPVYRR